MEPIATFGKEGQLEWDKKIVDEIKKRHANSRKQDRRRGTGRRDQSRDGGVAGDRVGLVGVGAIMKHTFFSNVPDTFYSHNEPIRYRTPTYSIM